MNKVEQHTASYLTFLLLRCASLTEYCITPVRTLNICYKDNTNLHSRIHPGTYCAKLIDCTSAIVGKNYAVQTIKVVHHVNLNEAVVELVNDHSCILDQAFFH